MQLYTVSTLQLICSSILIAAISAGTVIGYSQYRENLALPLVQIDADGTCIKVINFDNGSAYNCQDVDIVLRRYKKVFTVEQKAEDAKAVPEAETVKIKPDK